MGAILDDVGSKMELFGLSWAMLGHIGGKTTRDATTYAKKTTARRNWESQEGTHASVGAPPRNLQTGDSRLRLRLELETPTPTASPDSDCKRNWMNWMIGDSDWSLRREFEHATVPTARWRI